MRRTFPVSVLCLALGALAACAPEHVIPTEQVPMAGVRFIHAVPDTMALDFRFVDVAENSNFANRVFRQTTNLFYKGAQAGERHLRIFLHHDTDLQVASTVVKDTMVTLEAGKRYTFMLWGYAAPGSNPPMRLTVIEDDPADPGSQVALRVVNAAVGLGAVDVSQYTRGSASGTSCPGAGVPPATPTWAGVPEFGVSTYLQTAASQICYLVTPAGGGAALAELRAPPGDPGTVDLDGIPGTTVPGSAVSGFVVPRSVDGSSAPNLTTPTLFFLWDRRPPRTCSLC